MPWYTVIAPIFYAIFLWWMSAGVVFALYGRSRQAMRWGYAAATVALVLALGVLIATREGTGIGDIYLAVTCGIVVWAWQVAGYFMGFITGPQSKTEVPQAASMRTRFWLALRFSAYHEVLVILVGILLLALTWSSANRWGLWIYLALALMHTSAKLNVFLGVRNFRIDLLPTQMHYVRDLLGRGASNILFPFSVALATGTAMMLGYAAFQPDIDPAQRIGSLFVATMITLGLIEHWLLVLPLPESVWTFALHHHLPEAEARRPVAVETSREQVKGPAQ